MYYLKQLAAEMQKLLSSGMFELHPSYRLYLKSHINYGTVQGILKGTYKGNLLGLLGLARMKMENSLLSHPHNFFINEDHCWSWESSVVKMPDNFNFCHDYSYHYEIFKLISNQPYENSWGHTGYGKIFNELETSTFEKRHYILIERFLQYVGESYKDIRTLNKL